MERAKTRNNNIDILRAIALCIVIVYHIWVLTGQVAIKNNILRTFVILGGETGVTIFFLISGFGIYYSLKKMELSGNFSYIDFLKKRAVRIMPEYYISIIFILFLSNGAIYLSKQGAWAIFLHFIFAHNVQYTTAGAINGVLWTMAVVVQFYVVAIPIYKFCERLGIFSCGIAIVGTILCKYILFHYVMPWCGGGGEAAFWFSREMLPTVIDNFVLGIYVAKLIYEREECKRINRNIFYIGEVIAALILLYFISCSGLQRGIHTDNISGYTWHSLVALCIAIVIYCFASVELSKGILWVKVFVWVAKYEYGIYIIHLILIQALITYSPLVQYCNSNYIGVSYALLFMASIMVGYLFSLLVDAFRKEYILKL